MSCKRIGIFGGSFNPVHLGHLILAETSREICKLDEVRFIPTATAPHKRNKQTFPAEDRLRWLKLATADNPFFNIDCVELEREGVSYTADTLRHLHQVEPESQLFLLLGADMFHDLPNWREPEVLCELATPVAVTRAGEPPIDWQKLSALQIAEQWVVEMPPVQISSSEIRRKQAAGRSVRYLLPETVWKDFTKATLE